MRILIFFASIFIISNISFSRAFASQLTGDHCAKPMDAGTIMMGQPARHNDTYRLQLYRLDKTEVTSGGTVWTRSVMRELNIDSPEEWYDLKFR